MIYVAILGAGVVGSGVYEALGRNAERIARRSFGDVAVKYVCDVRELPDAPYGDKLVRDFSLIERDSEVRVVVESIGGTGVAYEFTQRALLAGKHVVTSNKELVATHGTELLKIAHDNNVNYMFEAAVGGGAPVVRPLIQCLSANVIEEIYGVLNGTTNYILTRMIEDGMSFEDALAQARALGYAEQNPAADVEGTDACRKISILASIACGKHIPPALIETEGIPGVTSDDVRHAAAIGHVIKLLGRYKLLDDGRVAAYVAPHLLPKTNIISNVSDVYNGIAVRGNLVGEVAFYGRGAGRIPTSSAVAADVIDAARHIDKSKNELLWTDEGIDFIASASEISDRWFVRASGALSAAVDIFGEVRVIAGDADDASEASFVTNTFNGYEFTKRLSEYKKRALVYSTFRVLENAGDAE